MLVVPLFHVHPDADHRHGEAGHVHGGTVHTVWSPDLDCEFEDHRANDREPRPAQDVGADLAQFSHAGNSHAEFTFSLLSDSTDRKQTNPLFAKALAIRHAVTTESDVSARRDERPAHGTFPIRLLHDLPSRAPPGFLL